MNTNATNYSSSFSVLRNAVEAFVQEVDKQKLNNLATDKWSVKDILRHIVFWHQYYAKQYEALDAGKKPFIFTSKGGSTRNQVGVDSLRNKTEKELVNMLNKAQSSLYKNIAINKVPGMDYTDKRHYATEDFLDVVIGHIKRHTIQVKRAKRNS